MSASPASASSRSTERKKSLVAAAIFLALIGALGVSPWRAQQASRHEAQIQEVRIRALFGQADGPCRAGMDSPCRATIATLRSMHDLADGSLLLGDLRVAHFLQYQPGGATLWKRWRQDQLSADELTSLGDVALHEHSIVFRSFFMYANVKRNGFPVPAVAVPGLKP